MTKEAIKQQIKEHPNYLMEKSFRLRFPNEYAEICGVTFPDNFSFRQKAYHYLNDDERLLLGVCANCGKRCKFINFFSGYSKYCSLKCSSNSEEVREKTKHTVNEKYGVDYPLQSKDIQDKAKITTLKHYGVEHPAQSKKIQEKTKKTNIKRYGVERPTQSKEIQEKVKQTNIKNLGVQYPAQSKKVREKAKITNIKKYGAEHPMKSNAIKQKYHKTCIERYGVENHNSAKSIKEKKKNTFIKKYGVENPFQSEEIKKKIKKTNLEKYGVENPSYSIDIVEKINKTKYERYGNDMFKFSTTEKDLLTYIHEIYNGEIIENDRTTIGCEIDIYLPEQKLGIEFNGDYWHMNPNIYNENDVNPSNKMTAKQIWKRDHKKIDLAKTNGITLVVIWESEWLRNNNATKDYIKTLLTN